MVKLRDDPSNATGPNQLWAMDWMHDELLDGRRLWVLTVVDTWSRMCPVMPVCRSAIVMEIIDALEQARRQHGLLTTMRVHQQGQRLQTSGAVDDPLFGGSRQTSSAAASTPRLRKSQEFG